MRSGRRIRLHSQAGGPRSPILAAPGLAVPRQRSPGRRGRRGLRYGFQISDFRCRMVSAAISEIRHPTSKIHRYRALMTSAVSVEKPVITTAPSVKLLLVDDHPENLLALEALLEAPGQDLVLAHSGAEALRHL